MWSLVYLHPQPGLKSGLQLISGLGCSQKVVTLDVLTTFSVTIQPLVRWPPPPFNAICECLK